MKKVFGILFLLAALGAAAYFFYEKERRSLEQAPGPVLIYGNVDIRDVSLGFRVPGRIAELACEEGDRVQKGALLAVLDKQPFEDEVALYKAQLETAEVARRKAEKPFLRRDRLTRIGAISAEERDDAEAARDEALAQLKTAQARLRQGLTRLADTELYAPSDGTILTRVREPGAVVAAGDVIYSLALDNPVWIRAYIDEPRLGLVHPGQKALVSTDSGGVYEGQVGFISPQAEFTPKTVETSQLRTDLVYRLRIIVNTPDKGLRQGMPTTIRLMPAQP